MTVETSISLIALPLLGGCGGAEPQAAPDLRGERLDVAEERLDELDLGYEELGGGTLGVIVRSQWTVCDQDPAPGTRTIKVQLIVDRDCYAYPVRVPNVLGRRLDGAEALLDAAGLEYDVHSDSDSGPYGDWEICSQEPAPGTRASRVVLSAASDCFT